MSKSSKADVKIPDSFGDFLKGPKILVFDIETSFKIAGVWGTYKQDIAPIQILQDTHVLCWSAKWLGEEHVYTDALPYHVKRYKKDSTDDSEVVKSAWKLLDEADYVMAHNSRFDVGTMNTRFMVHKLGPPSSYQQIDTLKIARKHFRFTSNKLGSLGTFLSVGEKMDTGGFQLWKDVVLNHDKEAWEHMIKYCSQDVLLLEDVYNELKPWHTGHPNTVLFGSTSEMCCCVCRSNKVKKSGTHAASSNTYQKFKCLSCGHNMRARRANTIPKNERDNILRSV